MPIRFVILGTPYTIKPTEELTAEAINELVVYVKNLVESYLRKALTNKGFRCWSLSTSLMKNAVFRKSMNCHCTE